MKKPNIKCQMSNVKCQISIRRATRLGLCFALCALAWSVLSCAPSGTTRTQSYATPVTPPSTAPVETPVKSPEVIPNLPMIPPVAQPDKVVEPVKDKGAIDWGGGVIRATGNGVVDPANTIRAQAILMAERAATVDAQRKLLEITKGVRVNGETMVEDFMLKNDFVFTQVDGLVQGARQVGEATYDSTKGIATVELVMNLYGGDGVSDAIRPDVPAEPATGKPVNPEAVKLLAQYSGIVIQGAGTGGKPALFPRLYDDKGNLVLDTRELVGRNAGWGNGAIQFVENLDEIMSNTELAKNPLIIKVREFQGKYLSDYVLPKEQSDLLKKIKSAVPYLLKAGRFILSLL